MGPGEVLAARTFARMFGSALRTAGNPDDPGYAFATDFLNETVRSVLPPVETRPTAPAPSAAPDAVAATSPAAASAPGDDGFRAVSERDDFREVVRGFSERAGIPVADDGQAALLIRGVLMASPRETGLGEEDLSRLRTQL